MNEEILNNKTFLEVLNDYSMSIVLVIDNIIYIDDLQEDKIIEWDIIVLLEHFIDQYQNKLSYDCDSEYLQNVLYELLMLRKNFTTI